MWGELVVCKNRAILEDRYNMILAVFAAGCGFISTLSYPVNRDHILAGLLNFIRRGSAMFLFM